MALVAIPASASFMWPGHQPLVATPGSSNRATLDAAGEYVANLIRASEAMTISHVGFRSNSVSGSPTADLRIETVDATTGFPTGTLWATNTNIVTGALSNAFSLHALTAAASIAAGDTFAFKIAYNSGTSFQVLGVDGFPPYGLPYRAINTGTPTLEASNPATFALGSSSTVFYPIRSCYPLTNSTLSTFNNTNNAERGLRFQVPFPCRVFGLVVTVGTSVGDFNIVLRDDAGNELSSSSTAVDGNLLVALTARSQEVYFDSPVTLAKDTWYRATIQPSSATNTAIQTMTLPSSDYRTAIRGGVNQHYTTFTTAGGWVDSGTDTLPILDLLIDQLDNGVASAAVGYATMSGGLQ